MIPLSNREFGHPLQLFQHHNEKRCSENGHERFQDRLATTPPCIAASMLPPLHFVFWKRTLFKLCITGVLLGMAGMLGLGIDIGYAQDKGPSLEVSNASAGMAKRVNGLPAHC